MSVWPVRLRACAQVVITPQILRQPWQLVKSEGSKFKRTRRTSLTYLFLRQLGGVNARALGHARSWTAILGEVQQLEVLIKEVVHGDVFHRLLRARLVQVFEIGKLRGKLIYARRWRHLRPTGWIGERGARKLWS